MWCTRVVPDTAPPTGCTHYVILSTHTRTNLNFFIAIVSNIHLRVASMTSAESARTSVYGADIAIKIVWQRLGMGMTFRDIVK